MISKRLHPASFSNVNAQLAHIVNDADNISITPNLADELVTATDQLFANSTATQANIGYIDFNGYRTRVGYLNDTFRAIEVWLQVETANIDIECKIMNDAKSILASTATHVRTSGNQWVLFIFDIDITPSIITESNFYVHIRPSESFNTARVHCGWNISPTSRDTADGSHRNQLCETGNGKSFFDYDVYKLSMKFYSYAGLSAYPKYVTPIASINLPTEIYAVIGDTLELFYKGFIKCLDIHKYYVHIVCAKGKRYKNRWIYTPQAGDTDVTFTATLYDENNSVIDTASTTIKVVAAASSPSSNKNVLCIGDSLTEQGGYVTEFRRRLVGTGGTPSGNALTNITFIGTQGVAPNVMEGYGGWPIWYFTDGDNHYGEYNPFWSFTLGRNSFSEYCSNNGYSGIDYAYLLCLWNGVIGYANIDYTTAMACVASIVDQMHSDYPSCKIGLIGMQIPSEDGIGSNFGCEDGYNYYHLVQAVFAFNDLLKAFADDPEYSAFVDFIHLSSQFDSDNNMPQGTRSVNARNATTESYGSNSIHPDASGYYQLADTTWRNIMHNL